MLLKFFVKVLPWVLVTLIVASFLNALMLTSTPTNEMTVGMGGEPSTLNPIKGADRSSSTVQASIFNRLLKYDENLEIAPELATDYELSQTTTFFFVDENAALTALLQLEMQKSKWPQWKLAAASMDGASLKLRLTEPGMDASREIAKLFKTERFAETLVTPRVVRIESPKPIAEAAVTGILTNASIVRNWNESPNAIELTILSATEDEVLALARHIYRADTAETDVSIRIAETLDFLAEPEVHFTLRKDVRWHDGVPFTSRDAAFTYEAIMDVRNASPRKPDFDTILHVATPSPHEFVVTYRKPFSPALLSWMGMYLLPAHILEGKTPEWWLDNFDRKPIGTGPFKFHSWKTSQYIRLVRNPDSFLAPAPWFDGVSYRIIGDRLAQRLAFETRQMDYWVADLWAVGAFQDDPRFDVFASVEPSYSYIGWNLRRAPFDDERVRRALSHAVNVPEIIKFLLYDRAAPSTGNFTSRQWFFNPDIQPVAYDKNVARRLLADVGWVPGPDGILQKDGRRFAFTLIAPSGSEILRDIATLVQSNLKAIGIEMKIELYEWSVFLRNHVDKGEFDAVALSWSLGLSYDQYQIWHSSQTNPEQLNFVGYKNPQLDTLLEEIRQEYHRDEIIALAGRIQRTIFTDQPYLFLFVPQGTYVLWKNTFRIRRPDAETGKWLDTPIEMTKYGWDYFSDYFYRPEFVERLPQTNECKHTLER